MAEMRKGQVFIVGALIFSSLLIATFMATQNSVHGSESLFKDYYSQAHSETGTAFNNGLEQNTDPDFLKRRLYSFERFVELRAQDKGIRYESIDFFVLPSKGEAVLINYRPDSSKISVALDGSWTNKTVGSKQWEEFSFTPGTVSVRVIVDNAGIDTKFDATTHRLLNYARMERENEIWANTVIH